ncbi:hypothetical protein [Acaryochloris marina]|uniref:hypothetical protein n=1 Tax=Acaryochloris marina TaxID=155978 RepID=UPI002018052E|nr:hypothetical protein [Acaryochloris marina]
MSYTLSLTKLLAPLLALVCSGSIATLQLTKVTEIQAKTEATKPTTVYLLESEQEKANLAFIKNLPSFGFDNLVADWTFLRFLQYFGEKDARQKIGYALTPKYFEIFVDRNPKFTQPYKFMSPATSIFAGRPDQSVTLIEKGLKSLSPKISPDAYSLWVSKASDEILFLGDNQAARNSYLKAAQWAQDSSEPEAQRIGAIVAKTAEFLKDNPDSKKARVSAWLMILNSAPDEETRQRSISEIQALGGQIKVTEQNTLKIQFPEED